MAPASRPHIPYPHLVLQPSALQPQSQPLAAPSELRNPPSGSFRSSAGQSKDSELRTAGASYILIGGIKSLCMLLQYWALTRTPAFLYPNHTGPLGPGCQLWALISDSSQAFSRLVTHLPASAGCPGLSLDSGSSVSQAMLQLWCQAWSPPGPVVSEKMRLMVPPPQCRQQMCVHIWGVLASLEFAKSQVAGCQLRGRGIMPEKWLV